MDYSFNCYFAKGPAYLIPNIHDLDDSRVEHITAVTVLCYEYMVGENPLNKGSLALKRVLEIGGGALNIVDKEAHRLRKVPFPDLSAVRTSS